MTETKKYWLACSCGNKFQVAVRQAGNEISCSCGKTVSIPRMMELKKLPPTFEEDDEPDEVIQMDQSRKMLLFLSAVILALGLVCICVGVTKRPTLRAALTQQTEFTHQGEWVYQDFAPLTNEEYVLSHLTAEDIEGISPGNSWSLWLALENGLEPSSSLEDRIRVLRIHFYAWLSIGAAISLIGLISLCSVVIGKVLQDKAKVKAKVKAKAEATAQV